MQLRVPDRKRPTQQILLKYLTKAWLRLGKTQNYRSAKLAKSYARKSQIGICQKDQHCTKKTTFEWLYCSLMFAVGVYVAYIGLMRLRPFILTVAPAMTSFPATPLSTDSLEVVRFANQYVQSWQGTPLPHRDWWGQRAVGEWSSILSILGCGNDQSVAVAGHRVLNMLCQLCYISEKLWSPTYGSIQFI